LTFDACRNIEVKGNVFDKEVLGKNIQLLRTKPSELKLDKKQGFRIETATKKYSSYKMKKAVLDYQILNTFSEEK
jgi:hypothetical protein